MSAASVRGAPGQRKPNTKPKFGEVRKPLARKTPLRVSGKKPVRMSADAEVQDAMLGKGRCWLTDVPSHRCTDGYTQRSHIVSQQLIRDEFEFGAYWSDLEERWMPAMEDSYDYEALYTPMRTLQEILDDNRNFIPTCPNGNRDGAEMVEALGYAGLPEGFDEFCSEYGFEFMDGRYWGRRA